MILVSKPATWVRGVERCARELASFVWPRRCAGCGDSPTGSHVLCERCLGAIPRLSLPLCARCLAREAADPVCARHAGFTVWPAWTYDEHAAVAIEALKYGGRTDLAPALAAELARVVPASPRLDFVTEVPLHPTRERERGYNQSALLAAEFARLAGVPHLPGVLRRVRATAAQARLGPAARRANLRGAFAARHPGQIAGRRVLVIDDVVTTGATLEAALAALRDAGAEASAAAVAWAA